jgi:hypothetical protein
MLAKRAKAANELLLATLNNASLALRFADDLRRALLNKQTLLNSPSRIPCAAFLGGDQRQASDFNYQ